jgi:hypothetical protein
MRNGAPFRVPTRHAMRRSQNLFTAFGLTLLMTVASCGGGSDPCRSPLPSPRPNLQLGYAMPKMDDLTATADQEADYLVGRRFGASDSCRRTGSLSAVAGSFLRRVGWIQAGHASTRNWRRPLEIPEPTQSRLTS